MTRSETLRIFAHTPFRLRYTLDDWAHTSDLQSTQTELNMEYADIRVGPEQKAPVRFSFFWIETGKWENCDYAVAMTDRSRIDR
jgi:glucoamylase